MSSGGQWVVVLCEDPTSFNFLRHFLLLKGTVEQIGQIRAVVSPQGCCGEHFVRSHLPRELHACRRRNSRGERALLIVMTDADTLELNQRIEQLRSTCLNNPLTQKAGYIFSEEPVAVIIPRRNNETWLKLLDGEEVDETANYKHGNRTQSCKSQVAVLLEHCRQQNLPPHATGSLLAACEEYHRVSSLMQ